MSTEFEVWYENAIWGNEDFKAGCWRAWDESRAALAAQAAENAADLDKLNRLLSHAGILKAQEEHNALRAEVESLRADAERMRWIAAHCKSTAEHWGGRWSIVVEGPAPKRNDEEDAFYAAIDAARAAKGQG